MKFRLGVVGHRETLQTVAELVDEYLDGVEVRAEEFGNDEVLSDAVRRVAELQTHCDGILYSRKDPYMLISGHLQHEVPVRYVNIDSSDLLISLLTASISFDLKPERFSIDSVDRSSALRALTSVGIDPARLAVDVVSVDAAQEGFVRSTLQEHLRNFEAGAQVCITNITDVFHSLQSQGVPAAIIKPSPETFVHEIRNLMLRHRLRGGRAEGLAIIHVRLRYKGKFRYYGAMPIREVDDLGRAAKLIAVFAEELDSAMFQLSRWEYLILCSRHLLENATDRFADISLMRSINLETAFDAAIGIGCGHTVKEAEANAHRALGETEPLSGTHAFIVEDSGRPIGPIRPRSERRPEESATEANLAEISRATGVSTQVLTRLYELSHSRSDGLFTSAQLAQSLGVSVRTVNRILAKLLAHRYAFVEGKDLTQAHGRPARVVRLGF